MLMDEDSEVSLGISANTIIIVFIFMFQLSKERLPDNSNIIELLEKYVEETQYKEVYVDLVRP